MSEIVIAKKKVQVKGSKPRDVAVADLKYDKSYQRDVVPKHQKIVDNFEPQAVGRIVVGERDDGTLWNVDGRQRATAFAKMGLKTIPAEVFKSDGPEHEAKIFEIVNRNRTPLTSLQIFNAAVTAGNEEAWAIKTIVEKCGFKIPRAKQTGNGRSDQAAANTINSTGVIQTTYREVGEEGLTFILNAIRESWPDDRLRLRESIMAGLSGFWAMHEGKFSREKLLERLKTTTPYKLIYTASNNGGTNSRKRAMRDVIQKLYRKNGPRS